MSKSKEELDALKEEVEAVSKKLQELTPEEIAQVSGGRGRDIIHLHVPVHDAIGPGVNGEPVIKPVLIDPGDHGLSIEGHQ